MLAVFAAGFIVGALLGYGWGRDDAVKDIRRRRREEQC